MQLSFQKDFLVRPATASDRPEVMALHQKFSPFQNTPFQWPEMKAEATNSLFNVILNSNGVLIGFFYCARTENGTEWIDFAVNPNFQRKELKSQLLQEIHNWAGEKIVLAAKLITGDWKTFVKRVGCKVESQPNGKEVLFFQ